jgi:hypothetical protein
MNPCGTWERVKPTPFPRTMGVSESFTYTEPVPVAGVRYQYFVVEVDANRNQVHVSDVYCEPCVASAGCPASAVPMTQGTVADWGRTLVIAPCAGTTCFDSYYAADPEIADQLRPYLGTGAVLRVFGQGGCGSIEGCAVTQIDRIEIVPSCDMVVPARHTTWGQVKVLDK